MKLEPRNIQIRVWALVYNLQRCYTTEFSCVRETEISFFFFLLSFEAIIFWQIAIFFVFFFFAHSSQSAIHKGTPEKDDRMQRKPKERKTHTNQ